MEKVRYTVVLTEFINKTEADCRLNTHKYEDLSYSEFKEVMEMVASLEPTDKRDFKVTFHKVKE